MSMGIGYFIVLLCDHQLLLFKTSFHLPAIELGVCSFEAIGSGDMRVVSVFSSNSRQGYKYTYFSTQTKYSCKGMC